MHAQGSSSINVFCIRTVAEHMKTVLVQNNECITCSFTARFVGSVYIGEVHQNAVDLASNCRTGKSTLVNVLRKIIGIFFKRKHFG